MSAKRSKQASAFIALCAVVYFVSYITRNSYSSAITEITEALNTTRDMTGLVGTAAFLTYGLGQIVCGVLGDCIAPRYMILMGVGATSVCNLLMPFMGGNVTAMIVLWGVNGFAQAMFWPPLVRLMAEHLSGKDYNDAVVAVTTASSVGNIFLYILSPVCIAVSWWNLIFYVTGIAGFVMMAVWFLKTRVLPVPEEKDDGHGHKSSGAAVQSVTQKVPFVKMAAMSGLFVILLCIILQGMLREHYKNDKIVVQSVAVGGAHTFQSIGWLDRDLEKGGMPDAATMLIGFNNRSACQTKEFYTAHLEQWIDRFAYKTAGKAAVVLIPAVQGVPRFYDQQDMADAVREIAAKRGLQIAPIDEAIAKLGPVKYKAEYLGDAIHPNPAGHKLFAEVLFKTFAK